MEKAKKNNPNRKPNICEIKTTTSDTTGYKQTFIQIGYRIVSIIQNNMDIKINYFDEWFDEGQIKLIPTGDTYALHQGSRITLNRALVKAYHVKDGKYPMTLNPDGSIIVDLTKKVGGK